MAVSLAMGLPEDLSELLLESASLFLNRKDKRQQAFRYIQRVYWNDGIDKANSRLQSIAVLMNSER